MDFLYSAILKTTGMISRLATGLFLAPLKLVGLVTKGEITLQETMESDEKCNKRVDTNEPVSLSLFVDGAGPLKRFLDPSDDDGFFTYFFLPSSHVTIPGLADKAPVRNGWLQVQWYRNLPYYYEFIGSDGKEYYYQGSKDLRDLNQFKAWTTLYGAVYEQGTGKKILESTTSFGGRKNFFSNLFKYLRSMKIR